MRRSLIAIAGSALLVASLPLAAAAQDDNKTFYWVSHGSPADPVWTFFLDGANQWAEDTGYAVNTSFHSGDVPSHQEAVRAAIAAGASGIVTSSPGSGQPRRRRRGGERGWHPHHQHQHARPIGQFRRLRGNGEH